MDPSLEIRKIPIAEISELIQILDSGKDSWKKLMACIPKSLESEKFSPKYGYQEMSMIEAAVKSNGSPTRILFDEWGTSGKVRPTIAHLLTLLIKCELLRAADFVSVNLLNGSPVKRPDLGPAAAVDVSLDKLLLDQSIKNMRIDSFLDAMSYPNIDTKDDILTTFDANINNKPTKILDDKKYLKPNMTNVPNVSKEINISAQTNSTNVLSSHSDLIKFSSDSLTENNTNSQCAIPAFSKLLTSEDDNVDSNETFRTRSDNASLESDIFQSNSDCINDNAEAMNNEAGRFASENISKDYLPNLSIIINNNSETNIPNFSPLQSITGLDSRNSNIPDFGAIQNSQSVIPSASLSSESYYSTESLSSNIPNISSLQNHSFDSSVSKLHVNTTLTRFEYRVLQNETNNFEDKQVFSNSNKLLSGKIGDGGFGSVYLSRNLMKIPVAIKKLTVDYTLTSNKDSEQLLRNQFKVEIEVLSKCKHENILCLLGYSCDGASHCLVSEYMENGSLKDNLSKNKNLSPVTRMQIAKGTARGIDYLHNGFETPLIHRDIKTANILLSENYVPKIGDFGLVKDKTTIHTMQTSKVIGTTAYMSPEAFRGDVSVKMDVFSFGVVLLELLTSLPSLDEDRIGKDIVTHVDEVCVDGVIAPLLDETVGEWKFADQLYNIAKECLEEKRKRPLIKPVYDKLRALV